MVVEQANEQVLPAVYLFVGRSLNATPVQLGTLTLCRAMVQTLASPLSGILGDRYNRVAVLSTGAFIWGIMTSAMALTVTLHQAMMFAGVNGLGLALLVPCCQSLIADLYPAEQRGRAFGTLQLTASLGGMLGGVFATNMGGLRPLGMDGWRAAFHCIALLSLIVGGLALLGAGGSSRALVFRPHHVAVAVNGIAGEQLPQPHLKSDLANQHSITSAHEYGSQHQQHHHHQHQHSQQHDHSTLGPAGLKGAAAAAAAAGDGDSPVDVRGRFKGRKRGVVADICWMLQIRTFQAIVLQGIVGCFPWQAMVFFTLWLQLTGFNDTTASLLVATFGAGVAGGALLGGAVGDRMAKRLPNNGRILTAQISVFCGIPLTWLLLKGLPSSSLAATPVAYGVVMFVMGLTCTWAGAGCNSPIFAEIVPDELRSTIYAFDRSFENSIAACAAPVVGLLAERAFGFSGSLSDEALQDQQLRARNAAALGSSLLACMALPWSLCLVFYTVLHFFYAKDKAMAKTWGGGSDAGVALYH
ncbi:hypothetical protein OEZ85_008043 [Tetradesmus obliquus]|uniref:Major facilitator superfamily (MFS) profile domain-containing protein n=1 Tax=Tetradesmus obliquus TaxID=3088 RepID=A0ABY8TI81_TETOB|nr:hypothetical protein OEZ85_008043 [Tetradesmus obliquus]